MTGHLILTWFGIGLLILVIGGLLHHIDRARRAGRGHPGEIYRHTYCPDCQAMLLTRQERRQGRCTICQLQEREWDEGPGSSLS